MEDEDRNVLGDDYIVKLICEDRKCKHNLYLKGENTCNLKYIHFWPIGNKSGFCKEREDGRY